jgi:hypothetical protein
MEDVEVRQAHGGSVPRDSTAQEESKKRGIMIRMLSLLAIYIPK